MLLSFRSLDSFDNEISYKAEYQKNDNTYVFDDLSAENTKTFLTIDGDVVRIKRTGDTESEFTFSENLKLPGYYKNNLGVNAELSIFTKKINIKSDKIYLEYDLILDDDVISSHKIWILFH